MTEEPSNFPENSNEDEFVQTAFPVPGSPGSFAIYPNQPRTWGLTIGKQF